VVRNSLQVRNIQCRCLTTKLADEYTQGISPVEPSVSLEKPISAANIEFGQEPFDFLLSTCIVARPAGRPTEPFWRQDTLET
jgi:hypothetical protein